MIFYFYNLKISKLNLLFIQGLGTNKLLVIFIDATMVSCMF